MFYSTNLLYNYFLYKITRFHYLFFPFVTLVVSFRTRETLSGNNIQKLTETNGQLLCNSNE